MSKNYENEAFKYTYSAKEQAELKRIREKYEPRSSSENIKQDKIEYVRRLDASVMRTAMLVSLICGILGALVLGVGMSLIMSDFSEILGSYSENAMIIGIIVGVIGAALVCLAYPVYNAVIKHKREKLAPEIIRLTDELMK